MTPLAWWSLAAFGVLAGLDWIAVGSSRRGLEYACKPGSMAALAVAALALDPSHGDRRAWFVVALLLSLAGDVFLMLPSDRFVEGLSAFLLAHLAYTVGLRLDGGGMEAFAWSALAVTAMAVPLGRRIVAGARSHDRRLPRPVSGYVVVISAMVTAALARGWTWAVPGALAFYVSDALIGWSRFVAPTRSAPARARVRVAIMVTYHLGQAGLVVSLLSP